MLKWDFVNIPTSQVHYVASVPEFPFPTIISLFPSHLEIEGGNEVGDRAFRKIFFR